MVCLSIVSAILIKCLRLSKYGNGKDTMPLILATRGDDGASGKGFVVPTRAHRSEILVVDSSL